MKLSKQCLIEVISPDVFSVNCLKYLSLSDLCDLRVISKTVQKICGMFILSNNFDCSRFYFSVFMSDHHMYLRLIHYDSSLLPNTINGRFLWELYQMLKTIKSELIKSNCFKYEQQTQIINPFKWLPVDLTIRRKKDSVSLRMGLFDLRRCKYEASIDDQCTVKTSMIPSFVDQLNLYHHGNLILITDGDPIYRSMNKLKHLLCECPVNDIDGNGILNMRQLPQTLESAVFINNGIEKICNLDQIFCSLKRLTVSNNKLEYKLDDLQFAQSGLSSLCYINLSRNRLRGFIDDLWSFASLPLHLKHLDLSGNEGITGILDCKLIMPSLKAFCISDCNLDGMKNIADIPAGLEKLDVSKNKIEMNIEELVNALPRNGNLKYLNCANNQLNGGLHLQNLPNKLEELDMSYNDINLVSLEFTQNLRSLNVSTSNCRLHAYNN